MMVRAILVALAVSCAAQVIDDNQRRSSATVGTGRLEGAIHDVAGNPIKRAEVTLKGEGLERVVLADDTGTFSFAGLPAGRFTIAAQKPGYPATSFGTTRANRPGSGLFLGPGQVRTGVNVTLTRGAVITGTVFDDRGQPISGVSVSAVAVRHTPGGDGVYTTVAMGDNAAESNERGIYRIYGLPPGEYTVGSPGRYAAVSGGDLRIETEADNTAVVAAIARVGPTAPGTTTQDSILYNYVPVFHPSALDPSDATTFVVAGGEVRSGIDVHLQLRPMSRLEGVVMGPDGSGMRAQISYWRKDRSRGANGLTVLPSSVDGRFSQQRLSPGEYTVMARSVEFPSQVALQDVSASGESIVRVSMILNTAPTLVGRIVFTSVGPTRFSTVPKPVIYARSVDMPLQSKPAAVGPGGVFVIDGLVPGRYRLSASLDPARDSTWVLESATVEAIDVTDMPFTVAASDALHAIVTLTERGSSITGTLAVLSGSPTDYLIVVIPADRKYWDAERRKAIVRPDIDGRYAFMKLPPGDYRLAALTDVVSDDLTDRDTLEAIFSQSVPVSVALGEAKPLDLKIGGGGAFSLN